MTDEFRDHLRGVLGQIEAEGLTKRERLIEGAQGAHVTVGGRRMLNRCASAKLLPCGCGEMNTRPTPMASISW